MKKIECIIRPEKLKELTDELLLAGIGGLTVTEVKGFGSEITRPQNYLFLPKSKVEIYAIDQQVDEIVKVITKCCDDGKFGSGKIAIFPLQRCIRVRTAQIDNEAIL